MNPHPVSWKQQLVDAQHQAAAARFDSFLSQCRSILESNSHDVDALLQTGVCLQGFGYLSIAKICFLRALELQPGNVRAIANLANLARDAGDHRESRRLYSALQARLPNHPVIRRNTLVSLEYDPDATDAERLEQAMDWGAWAVARAGGTQHRPSMLSPAGRPLRVGYVSSDFCQHTVGLFIKDVLAAHDPTRVAPFAYSAGHVNDWVTQAIKNACTWRDVSQLDDAPLAARVREDGIDVLVDLSGHTAGSRLTAFAYRPAPFQISWLGYFATTGLPFMDAVMLDAWHAPPGMEAQFTEPILRLQRGRLCYVPVPFAPDVALSPPSLKNGFITFGSFNNTAKLNGGVLDLWARILSAVPESRLLLKWRTFQDEPLCQGVRSEFEKRGVSPERVVLRGAAFHADMLREYADIDIALDPFPFTGGLTSCEALWMGVPVITWPQTRAVSRQTFAFVSAIGLQDLAAENGTDYLRKAVALAGDTPRLASLRKGLRERMRTSMLCDVAAFTRSLEESLHDLVRR